MSAAGDKLCERVLHLSGCAGVPPIVSAHLGQAVAQYKLETDPPPAIRFARAVWLGWAGGILAICGVSGIHHLPLGGTLDWPGTALVLLAVSAQLGGAALLAVAGVRLSRLR